MDKMVRMSTGGGRLPWIDEAKGIGVYLVFLGHMWYSASWPVVNTLIYSFHVPYFFILCGLVLRTQKYSVSEFLSQKFYSLMVPALIYQILALPADWMRGYQLQRMIEGLFFWKGKMCSNDPCWFFVTLFQVMCLLRFVNVTVRSRRTQILLSVLSFLAGGILYALGFGYFGVDKLFICCGFVVLGVILGREDCRLWKLPLFWRGAFGCGCAVIWLAAALKNGKISLYGMSIGSYGLFLIAGLCGSVALLLLCHGLGEKLDRRGWLSQVAQNSVLIVCSHYFLMWQYRYFIKRAGLNKTPFSSLMILILVPLAIWCYVPVSRWLSQRVPVLTGKYRKKKENP